MAVKCWGSICIWHTPPIFITSLGQW